MIRPFQGIQTVGAASQPVFGTTTTAPSNYAVDRYTGKKGPGNTTPPIIVTVTTTVGFWQNDRILVGPKANFTRANFTLLDKGTIAGIIDATHLSVHGLGQNHAAGEYVLLNECASLVEVIPVNSQGYYLGHDSTVSATDPSVFGAGAPQYYAQSPTTLADSYMTSEFWLSGTAGDTFVARFDQV